MAITTHMARVTGPVAYLTASGKPAAIPLGPCIVERGNSEHIDIIWGASGQNSVALLLQDLESAEKAGHLLVLDQLN